MEGRSSTSHIASNLTIYTYHLNGFFFSLIKGLKKDIFDDLSFYRLAE
jgi:hypothetical protein